MAQACLIRISFALHCYAVSFFSMCVCFYSTNSGNTSDLFLMSPHTLDSLDSLMPGEAEANQGHLGELQSPHTSVLF